MKKDFNNIDDVFASELKAFSPSPPTGMWANIEQKLPQKQAKRSLLPFYRIAASIALLISATGIGIYLFTNSPEQQNHNISEVVVNEMPTKNAIKSETIKTDTINSTLSNVIVPKQNKITNSQPVANKSNTENLEEEAKTEGIITSSNEKEVLKSENLINSIEADILPKEGSDQTIVIQTKDPNNSDAYLALLSEFESIDEEIQNYSKWAIGGQAGPQYTYRQLSSEYASQEYLDLYNQSETGLMAYAGGVNIAYKPARRLSIQSGIYYSKMGQTSPAQAVQNWDNVDFAGINPLKPGVSNTKPTNELRVSTSMGEIASPESVSKSENYIAAPNPYADVSNVNQYLEFLEIPLMARYAVIDRKINFHFLGGLSTNFLIASPVYLDNGDYYAEASNLNKINYSGTFGLGLGYNFASNISFSIEPQFKYYLNKVNTNASADVHPYSLGVFTGLTYLF